MTGKRIGDTTVETSEVAADGTWVETTITFTGMDCPQCGERVVELVVKVPEGLDFDAMTEAERRSLPAVCEWCDLRNQAASDHETGDVENWWETPED